jgi:hypothetical protein
MTRISEWNKIIHFSQTNGGTAEKLGGGKFANGAVTGAYVMMFNHLGEEVQKNKRQKYLEAKLVELIQNAADLEKARHENNRNMQPEYIDGVFIQGDPPQDQINIDFWVEGSVNGRREFLPDVSIELGGTIITGSIYYYPSGNSIVRNIRYLDNPVSPGGVGIRGYGIEFINNTRYTVLYWVFPDQSSQSAFKDYIFNRKN